MTHLINNTLIKIFPTGIIHLFQDNFLISFQDTQFTFVFNALNFADYEQPTKDISKQNAIILVNLLKYFNQKNDVIYRKTNNAIGTFAHFIKIPWEIYFETFNINTIFIRKPIFNDEYRSLDLLKNTFFDYYIEKKEISIDSLYYYLISRLKTKIMKMISPE
jgi:hypothetical protein